MKSLEIEKEVKICKYRNCDKELLNMRSDAKFCCRKHKQYEKIYLKRSKGRQES